MKQPGFFMESKGPRFFFVAHEAALASEPEDWPALLHAALA